MKSTILIISLIITQSVIAERTCESYTSDEWPDSRYTVDDVSGDNVVVDNKTGLMWKQCSQGLTGAYCMTGTVTKYTWQQALMLVDTQNTSGFAGYTDWRVPNKKELGTLVTRNCNNPSINENVFPNTLKHWYWSSTMVDDGKAWIVSFDYGYDFRNILEDDSRIRLVRSFSK